MSENNINKMSIMRLVIVFGILGLWSGCKNSTSTKEQREEVKKEMEPTKKIEGIDKDSIKILLHKKINAQGIYSAYERTVFLDYKKHSKYKKEYYKSDSLYLNYSWFSGHFIPPRPAKDLVINSCNSILKTYITISKLNGSHILFSNDYEDTILSMVYVKDSVLTTLDLMGWVVFYYKEMECTKDKYRIDLFKNPDMYTKKIEIKVIDNENDIQIWKTTTGSHILYELKAPLNYALTLPVLIIENTLGLDAWYEGLDELNLEKLFKE